MARRRELNGFVGWLLVGALGGLGMLAILSIGAVLLLVAAVLAGFLLVRQSPVTSLTGVASGLALPALYVAFTNRSGPGEVCHPLGSTGTECTDQWNPVPWLAVGLVLFALGIAAFVALTHAGVSRENT